MVRPHLALQTLSALILNPSLVSASSTPFESLHQVPRGWTRVRSAGTTENIRLRVSLRQQNLDEFYDKLLQVSTPDHPQYGRHYEGHELRSLLKPSDEASATAISWLQDNNVTDILDDGDYLMFRTTVGLANKLLDTQFDWYQGEDGEQMMRTIRYSVPQDVAAHINFVQPTTRFGTAKRLASHVSIVDPGAPADGTSKWVSVADNIRVNAASAVDPSCNTAVTPQCLFQLYNVNFKADPAGGNTVGYASFVNESARFTDMAMFEQVYAPYAANRNFSVVTMNGGINDQTSQADSGEANLDQQYVLAVGFDVPVTEFSVGGLGQLVPDGESPTQESNSNEPFLEWLIALSAMDNSQIPNSISVSYGENEQEIPLSYATQVCNMFAQLGARGKSILIASGDSGVGSFCQANDGTNATRFQPQFPASCPYVTAVGGTQGISPETATFFSSGGFSNVWPRPAYQEQAVSTYLQTNGNNFTGLFNATGRGFPDVAAQSVNYRIIDKGSDSAVQGTSAAAPTFNGIVALLNSARLQSGQPTLGFLNPWLYSTASAAMNDVTTGASTGCDGQSRFHGQPNGSPAVPGASWAAAPGWDAVTGLGTPDFGKMLAISSPNVKNEGGVISA
ncbi:hypothetical protein KVR01_004092 [Diaporthe batatas]|uniref:uncharacterized protein n=1 Tax=Diaporthe batatas TaxID=748121 RepID=UPI001D039B4F|nr:uncharacterized protein KVR01_004092 [Diaporthe batatas]KAG8165540.1 hypothetical protein KVR01_004092 [Diaporthe batatas]